MPVVPQTKAAWTNNVDRLNTTNLNAYLRDPIRFLMTKPVAELRATSVQSIPNNSYTAVAFQAETVDTDVDGVGGHSTASNITRYTARYAGWYRVGGSVTYGASAVGRRGCRWSVNGAALPASAVLIPSAPASSSVATDMLIRLEEGDYIELQTYQDSGGSLSTLASADNQARMTIEWSRL